MTATAHPLFVRELGGGRWLVEFELAADPDDPDARPRPHLGRVALRSATGSALGRIESLAVPRPSARDRFSVVLALDDPMRSGEPARFELTGAGWSSQVELTAYEEPAAWRPYAAPSVPAAVDYRARDFEALRRMMLGVIDERFGAGLADHPVSQTAALIEELAYLGDALSYSQDAVATEAYLATARRRISVVRHAALLDYVASESLSARAWLRFEVSERLRLPARTKVLARAVDLAARVGPAAVDRAVADGALVFETLEAVDLLPDAQPYELADEVHRGGRLDDGATAATLSGPCSELRVGGLILIEPATSERAAAGHVVRVTGLHRDGATTHVEWAPSDALPGDGARARRRRRVRAGNLVLADHGATHGWTPLAERPVAGRRYWPVLPHRGPAFSAGAAAGQAESAAESLAGAGRQRRAAVQLREGHPPDERHWVQRESLLESTPYDAHYVVEVEDDGTARVRFGDGTNGVRPQVGALFEVLMRSGGGSAGNVAAGTIAHVVTADERVLGVRNPTRAIGGADPESLTGIRLNAPLAFRTTDRAVTAREYSAAALEVDGVADAATIITPTGTGPVARVRIHAGEWSTPVRPLVERVQDALDRRRPVGVVLDVQGATAMPVTIELQVTVQRDWTIAAMSAAVDATVRADLLRPRRFGFGTDLYRSEVVKLVASLPGVADVTLAHFDWTGARPGLRRGEHLQPAFGHVIRIENDPTVAGLGSVSFTLRTAR